MTAHRAAVGVLAALLLPASVGAQGYRVRVDTRMQHVTFRGVQLDSVLAADLVPGADGGLYTPDGIAATCSAGAYCLFWRPGAERDGAPWVTSVDASVWGLGVEGLSLRASARARVDLTGDDTWPGTTPPAQLIEGYAQYARPWLTARLGRQVVTGRLGYNGFDGARATVRLRPMALEIGGYAGWSLARGSALPLTSAAANPLGEYRPDNRLVVAGAHAGWRSAWGDLRAEYEREVDPAINKFSSERLAVSAAVRPIGRLSLSGGGEYDIAMGEWGSADGALRWADRRVDVTVGARRYRPFFPLWTIWGAFSPVAHHGGFASVQVAPIERLRLRGRYERFAYEDAEAETPLVHTDDDGWRWSFGGAVTPHRHWTLDLDLHAENSPGANSTGWQASATWDPGKRFTVTGFASNVLRPLEYRFTDAEAWHYGLDGSWSPTRDLRLGLGVSRYDEDRRRPDAAAFDWSQTRLTARMTWFLSDGGADRVARPVARDGAR